MTTRLAGRSGMTLIEILIVITMIGLMTAVVVPRLRTSERQKVYEAARQVTADLEAVRTRSLAATGASQIVFDVTNRIYTGYLDWDRDGTVVQNQTSIDSLAIFRPRTLPTGLTFGRGSASALPGFTGSGAITFTGSTVSFDSRGISSPIGTRGVIYIQSSTDANAVAAVSVTGAANTRVWRWIGGTWQ